MKPIYRQLGSALALTFAIAACVPQPKTAPPTPARPAPAPSPTPPPPTVHANWMDAPQTPGDWRYERIEGGSRARFGSGAGNAQFGISCLASSRQITLNRYGARSPSGGAMTVRSEAVTRALPIRPGGAREPASATLSASDRLLDAMALSKGRFAVEVPGSPPLYLPSWAEVTRVIEDCR